MTPSASSRRGRDSTGKKRRALYLRGPRARGRGIHRNSGLNNWEHLILELKSGRRCQEKERGPFTLSEKGGGSKKRRVHQVEALNPAHGAITPHIIGKRSYFHSSREDFPLAHVEEEKTEGS